MTRDELIDGYVSTLADIERRFAFDYNELTKEPPHTYEQQEIRDEYIRRLRHKMEEYSRPFWYWLTELLASHEENGIRYLSPIEVEHVHLARRMVRERSSPHSTLAAA